VPPYTVAEVIIYRPAGSGGWFYATVVADVADPFRCFPGNTSVPTSRENTGSCRWVTVGGAAHLHLHPGVAALLPRLDEAGRSAHLRPW
jgi:hypothetical protein